MIDSGRRAAGRLALPLACVLLSRGVPAADPPAAPPQSQPASPARPPAEQPPAQTPGQPQQAPAQQSPAQQSPAQPPAAKAPPPAKAAPAPEDDLFEFLGSVDMDDPALVNYLGRPPDGSGSKPGRKP